MKAQGCRFKTYEDAEWQCGIAFLKIFDLSSVHNIVNMEGQVQSVIHDYELMTGPMCHLDSEMWSHKK